MNIANLVVDLKKISSEQTAAKLKSFFKTDKGQYAYNDVFWGIRVPQIRSVSRRYYNLHLDDIKKLLIHPVHEVRFCALLIMIYQFKKKSNEIYNLYLENTKFVNSWDLVDLSAPKIVGEFLLDKNRAILYELAKSNLLWDRRIAIVSTFALIKRCQILDTLNISKILLNDREDLIRKATGWMLREIGKSCSENALIKFLEDNASNMARVTLRYAIEHLSCELRDYFMQIKK